MVRIKPRHILYTQSRGLKKLDSLTTSFIIVKKSPNLRNALPL
ncbi:Uncharacterised protein [Bacteroides heparinolyticus]|uniref:Uncharacterized protein n=1 Tax=Prevotella heparinolytica TaxID=28113 RepID=A0A449I2A3_9BACE|nr:Uncharacterised protein [Bacteroides heparinolyticus]